MTWETIFQLHPDFFSGAPKTLAEFDGLTASAFRYRSGVAGLRLRNSVGQLVMLPFQGQQIWRAEFYDRPLTMKSMFTEPYPTTAYLHTYGGFLLHCGATAMGVPSAEDDHPLHGELPNAPYQSAQLLIGRDDGGSYVALTGSYRYTVAFNHNYVAQPQVKLYQDSARLPVSMTIENLKNSPMELMYMAHVNFKPVDNGQLRYSALCTPDHVRVRSSIPGHIRPPEGYQAFLEQLEAEPKKHNILKPDLAFDPEVVFYIDYLTDEAGRAHSMQLHPEGGADFISHRPEELDHGVRWISRTPDQDALGLVLPATAEPEGYSAEKEKGNLKSLSGGETFTCQLELGALTAAEARAMTAQIETILAGE